MEIQECCVGVALGTKELMTLGRYSSLDLTGHKGVNDSGKVKQSRLDTVWNLVLSTKPERERERLTSRTEASAPFPSSLGTA